MMTAQLHTDWEGKTKFHEENCRTRSEFRARLVEQCVILSYLILSYIILSYLSVPSPSLLTLVMISTLLYARMWIANHVDSLALR